VTYPGDPGAVIHKRQRAPCPITSPDVLDTDWIPQVAASSTRTARSAVRHLHAAISSFTPLNMARHGVADDTGRIAGKRLMAQAHRHLLLAKDLADAPPAPQGRQFANRPERTLELVADVREVTGL